ncbi:contractile injection system protein, VgrG/Pvc8 family, partial [Erwinia amylovora]|uniref:contractile injection system protein, VgrG/Pvc8 family n=1 Tax=Erwinia amylovora TaxID=552 RepID=UPI0039BC99FC
MFDRITVQLPMDGLLFWRLSGREALSQSFELSVQLLSTDARIERRALLGQPITVCIPTQGLLNTRYLNGKITKVSVSSQALGGTRYAVYNLVMEPDLWPLKRDKNLRIFQGQTVPQIVKTLLGEYNVTLEDRAVSSQALGGTRYAVYNLVMEPDLWPLKRDKNLRIFQGQTV